MDSLACWTEIWEGWACSWERRLYSIEVLPDSIPGWESLFSILLFSKIISLIMYLSWFIGLRIFFFDGGSYEFGSVCPNIGLSSLKTDKITFFFPFSNLTTFLYKSVESFKDLLIILSLSFYKLTNAESSSLLLMPKDPGLSCGGSLKSLIKSTSLLFSSLSFTSSLISYCW